ncbi:hypothetical protein HY045_03935 [Candidatus Woesebacteria bacterium]|nr:hypothetical protein [Candidatus Woesebacteria bacterium]
MKNWSVDTTELKKKRKDYNIWKLESLINFDLGKEKISKRNLIINLKHLKINTQKNNFLKFILSEK